MECTRCNQSTKKRIEHGRLLSRPVSNKVIAVVWEHVSVMIFSKLIPGLSTAFRPLEALLSETAWLQCSHCITTSPLASSWYQFNCTNWYQAGTNCLANRDTEALATCPELCKRNSVFSGIERRPSGLEVNSSNTQLLAR